MSQRNSGYDRISQDEYFTPQWVTLALVPHLPVKGRVYEPACGSGMMASALIHGGYLVCVSDISTGTDFLEVPHTDAVAIVTNPPFGLAEKFIVHALDLMKPQCGMVAMLLRTDYDHAKTRKYLFAEHPAFAKKLVLTKRIVWFERPGAAPSFNHAWFVWDWQHVGPPTLAYGP